jgi:lipid A 4'-phosphatase
MTTGSGRRNSFIILVLLVAGAAALVAFGEIDRWVAGLFFSPREWFLGNREPYLTLRYATTVAGWGAGLFLLGGIVWRVLLGRRYFGLSRGAIGYLLVVFLLGPMILANAVLKDHWDRARPAHTEQFGGPKRYTPPLVIADQCESNCSFVSGEAALGFAYMAFGFVARTPARRRWGIAAGIALGSAFGLLRIAEGGHYLSDVYFAGLFMALIAWLAHRVFVARGWLAAAP